MKKTIDCYGHRNTDSERFRKMKENWIEISTDAAGNTYFRFSTDANGPIHHISTDAAGNTIRRWAFGAWSDRENLTYSAGLADTMTIDVEE